MVLEFFVIYDSGVWNFLQWKEKGRMAKKAAPPQFVLRRRCLMRKNSMATFSPEARSCRGR